MHNICAHVIQEFFPFNYLHKCLDESYTFMDHLRQLILKTIHVACRYNSQVLVLELEMNQTLKCCHCCSSMFQDKTTLPWISGQLLSKLFIKYSEGVWPQPCVRTGLTKKTMHFCYETASWRLDFAGLMDQAEALSPSLRCLVKECLVY